MESKRKLVGFLAFLVISAVICASVYAAALRYSTANIFRALGVSTVSGTVPSGSYDLHVDSDDGVLKYKDSSANFRACVMDFGAQVVAGVKTFSSAPLFTAAADFEETGAGTDTIKIQAPSSIAANVTLTLPVDDGTANQFLKTDGNGVLSWDSPAGTGTTVYSADIANGNGNVSNEHPSGWITGNCSQTSGTRTCTVTGFTNAPSCWCVATSGGSRYCLLNGSPTSTTVVFETTVNGASDAGSALTVFCKATD